ncbi:MAG TPA: FAD-binding oxidoreductase [Quisquiliibacterium sp.]|nr:FAD-binding oxidoreductase [Quisquiliibacterium sp.]
MNEPRTDTRNPASSSDLEALRACFSGRLLLAADDIAPFVSDWRRRYLGSAIAVAQPDSAEDVAAVVRWCAAHRVPVVPQGGNTGLVGGATPDTDGRALVLSLTRMNRIRTIDPVNNTVTADAGCVLATLQQAAAEAGRLFPLSLAAEGSCTLGGNLSTNAGGVQVLRYGNTRDLCLGLEVVTPAGELWSALRGLRKDNTGYDLKQLFIGAEGTLGIITAATMKLYPRPVAQITALAALPDVASALRLLEMAQRRLAASLTAFELISGICLDIVERQFEDSRRPIPGRSPRYVLLESSDFESAEHAQSLFERLMSDALDAGVITDAAIAASIAQSQAFWALRERIPEAQTRDGNNVKHDISLPISAVEPFVRTTDAAIERAFPGARMVTFGHLGDGNLHYNVAPPEGTSFSDFKRHEPALNRLVHDAVASFGGSFSAEHGLGQLKVGENVRYKSALDIRLMQAVKHALDPLGLMNPGKVLPAQPS